MATYISGVTDFIPQIQPFKPDFNFYAGALQMKQTQYDSAHKQVSNLYGSLLNAPMLRDSNIKAREDYFKVIEGEIKKVSNLDLSLQQNVDSATQLFSGLYENKSIVKDMMWTRSYQNEVQRGEAFRNCLDPAKCGGSYWEGGIKALNYKAEEFRNASDEQALGFNSVRYTPYQNVLEKAIKLAKDADLNITVDQVQGRYIVTTKNGPNLIDPLNSLFTGVLANDPAVMDYYKTKAYIDRKDWVQSNVPVYGSQENAEMAYMDQITGGLHSMLSGAQQDVDSRVNNIEGQKKQLEQRIRTEGANPNGTLAEQYRALNGVGEQALSSQASISEANKVYSNAYDPAMRASMGENIDTAMASYLLAGDIGMAAETLAYKDFEQTLKADPYAMEAVQHSNRMMLENMKFEQSKQLKQFEFDLKAYEQKQAAMGGDLDNVPMNVKVTQGGATTNLSETGGYDVFKDQRGQVVKDLSGGEKKLTVEMMSLTQQQSKNEGGRGMATDDLIKFGDILFTELSNVNTQFYNESKEEYISNSQTAKDNKALAVKWQGMSYDQKVQFAQKQDFNRLVNHSGISGTVLDNIYSDLVLPAYDFNNPSNRENKRYLESMWVSPENISIRNNITQKNAILQGMGEWYASESQNVLQDMKSGTFAEFAPLMQMYINPETGGKRSSAEFAQLYAEAQSQTEGVDFGDAYQQGIALYNGEIGIPKETSTSSNVFSWILGGVPGILMNNSGGDGNSLDHIWAQTFSKYGKANGQELSLGLMGSDNYASQGLRFPVVDPAKYMSGATTNTLSYFKDALGAQPENVKYSLGGPAGQLPTDNDPTMQAFLTQLFGDMVTRKDPKDDARPMLDVQFQNIAGSDQDWSALHVKLNHPYMKQFVGTEKSPGPLYGMNESLSNGFTVYLNNESATNGFHTATKSSDLENMLHYTGQYKFDSYPEYTQDLKLQMSSSGNYLLTGNVMTGYDESGSPVWQPIYTPYDKLGTDPNDVVNSINGFIENIAVENQQLQMYHNSQNGVKDPAALLNQ